MLASGAAATGESQSLSQTRDAIPESTRQWLLAIAADLAAMEVHSQLFLYYCYCCYFYILRIEFTMKRGTEFLFFLPFGLLLSVLFCWISAVRYSVASLTSKSCEKMFWQSRPNGASCCCLPSFAPMLYQNDIGMEALRIARPSPEELLDSFRRVCTKVNLWMQCMAPLTPLGWCLLAFHWYIATLSNNGWIILFLFFFTGKCVARVRWNHLQSWSYC